MWPQNTSFILTEWKLHLLVDMDPRYGPARFLKILRGRSSRLLRSEFRFLKSLPSLWTNSCFIATTGGTMIDIVKEYIENQKGQAI